jgi:hypothetical protein
MLKDATWLCLPCCAIQLFGTVYQVVGTLLHLPFHLVNLPRLGCLTRLLSGAVCCLGETGDFWATVCGYISLSVAIYSG